MEKHIVVAVNVAKAVFELAVSEEPGRIKLHRRLSRTVPCVRSKTPCAPSAITTTQSDEQEPNIARAKKAPATSDSRTSARVDAPMTANRQ